MKKIIILSLIGLSSLVNAQQPYELNLPMKPVYNSFNVPIAQSPSFRDESKGQMQLQQCNQQVSVLMQQIQELQQNQLQWQQYANNLKKQQDYVLAQQQQKTSDKVVKVANNSQPQNSKEITNNTVEKISNEKSYGAVPNSVNLTRSHKEFTYLLANNNQVTEEASNQQQKENYLKARDNAYKKYGSLENQAKAAIANNTVAEFLIKNPEKSIPFIDAVRYAQPNFQISDLRNNQGELIKFKIYEKI